MPPQDKAIPQLPARSMARTLAFYARLGFDGEIAAPDGSYAFLNRGDLEIHLFAYPDLRPEESSFGCYLRVQDVDAIYLAFAEAKLPAQGIPRMTQLEDKPWGMREFAVIDEDGSLIRIGQEL